MYLVDEKSGDCEEETSNIGMIEVVVLRCNELPKKKKGRWHQKYTGSSSRELDDPTIRPHPHSKPYWKNWAIEEERVIDPLDPKAVYEKDIKKQNLTHRVATEDEEIVRSVVTDADILFLDSFEKPYCILVMYYRSRGSSPLGLLCLSIMSNLSRSNKLIAFSDCRGFAGFGSFTKVSRVISGVISGVISDIVSCLRSGRAEGSF